MKIYTRHGDKGETSLFGGIKVPKNDIYVEAIGTIDEGNSAIGFSLSFFPKNVHSIEKIREQIEIIQHALFDLGAALAMQEKNIQKPFINFNNIEASLLEKWIDEMDEELTKLQHFILPGGHPAGAALHLSRSIIRRAERVTYTLLQDKKINENFLIFLNRLSDYLFMASRYVNYKLEIPEIKWEHHKIERDSKS